MEAQIDQLIAQGRTQEAISLLLDFAQQSKLRPFQEEASRLSNRFENFETDSYKGKLTDDEQRAEQVKIVEAIQNILSRYKSGKFIPNKNQTRTNLINYGDQQIPRLLTKLPLIKDKVIGRDQEIKELRTALEQESEVVLVNGMGGIGKTTTAMAYANQFKDQYVHIAWVEQLGDLTSDLTTNKLLSQNLGVSPSKDAVADTKLIFNKLSSLNGPSLLIIDNADEQLNAFKDYLPKAPDWQVLITSRKELSFPKTISLDFLKEKDALALFFEHYGVNEGVETALEIIRTVDFHTLTIELLAKTAKKRKISLRRLKQLLEDRGLQIGRKIGFSIAHSREKLIEKLFPYLKAIFQTDVGFSEEELQVLKYFIGLPPIFISYEDLLGFLQTNEEEEERLDELTFALDQLQEKGWLTYDEEKESYKMHRVIQDVLFEQLKPTYQDLEVLVEGISSKLHLDQSKDNPVDKFQYVPFGERVVFLFPEIEEESYANFLSNLAIIYRRLGRYTDAAKRQNQALVSDIKNFGELHPNVAICQSNLATVYKDLGNYEQAAKLLQAALESDIKNFGELHPNVAIRQSNLATVYQDLGNYEQAAKLLQAALESDIKNFGELHPNVAIRQSNLAGVYRDLGNYEQAAKLLQAALVSGIKSFGDLHPNVATRQSNLALVYRDLGNYEQAAILLQAALESDIKNFGELHPNVAIRQSNLALIYRDLGNYEQAAMLLQAALVSDIKNFRELHPNVAIRQSNLAGVYQDLNQIPAAKELWEKSLETFLTVFGPDHPRTKTVKRFLDNLEE